MNLKNLAIFLMLMLLLVACGSPDDSGSSAETSDPAPTTVPEPTDEPEPTEEPEPEPTEEPEPEPTEAPVEEAAEVEEVMEEETMMMPEIMPGIEGVNVDPDDPYAPEGDFVMGYVGGFASYNPYMEGNVAMLSQYNVMYEGLFYANAEGNIVNMLAAAHSYDETLTELTLFLREGVTFHDGTPFNAEVVKANMEWVKANGNPVNKGQISAVESVEVVDDMTVLLKLSRPDLALIPNLARYPGLQVNPALIDTVGADPTGAGTGPYMFVADGSVVDGTNNYAAFPDYWLPGSVNFETVQVTAFAAGPNIANLLNGLVAGDFDVAILAGPPVNAAKGMVAEGSLEESEAPLFTLGIQFIDLNGDIDPAFADKNFRCGVSQALNREAMAQILAAGPTYDLALEGGYGDTPDVAELLFNADSAAELLAPYAGLEFSMVTGGPFGASSQVIQGILAEYDITMEIRQGGIPDIQGALSSGEDPLQVGGFNQAHLVTEFLLRAMPQAPFNPSGFAIPEVVELVQEASTLSNEEAEPLLAEAKDILLSECIMVPWGAANRSAYWQTGTMEGMRGIPTRPGSIEWHEVDFAE